MGTNYYWHENICPCCKRSEREVHIGKSSGGWCFTLHVDPDEGIHDMPDWIDRFNRANSEIRNEYGDVLTTQEMIAEITERSGHGEEGSEPYGYGNWAEFHWKNGSERGINGLLRHKLSRDHCIKNGEGTWDCIIGNFS